MIKLLSLLLTTTSLISGIGVASIYHQDVTIAVLSSMLVAVFTHFLNNSHKYLPKKKVRKSKKKSRKIWLFLKIYPVIEFLISLL
jgi:hypothetical protein